MDVTSHVEQLGHVRWAPAVWRRIKLCLILKHREVGGGGGGGGTGDSILNCATQGSSVGVGGVVDRRREKACMRNL